MSTENQPDVLIAGAGIGGLTAAIALHARGIDATVAERADQLRPLGVGINLLPHAVAELDRLGLGPALADIAVAPHSIGFYDPHGALLFNEPRGIDGGYGHPQLSVHRGRLQMVLLDAIRDRCGPDVVRTATAVRGFRETHDHVSAMTDGGTITADILIGADGLQSDVRAQLHPSDDELRWSGVTMYRGATTTTPFLDGRTMAIIKGDNGIDLVTYPIGADLVNWVLMVPEARPGTATTGAGWNTPADPDTVLAYVADWNLGWLDAAALIGMAQRVFAYPMVDRDPLPWWGSGHVTLLGDAAHPMYPVGANGGSQAIVDAAALAEHLDRHRDDAQAGLRAYEAERRPATAEVIRANRDMQATGDTRNSDELAGVAAKYRRTTRADDPRGV